jgi:hypothetical protein
MLLALPAEIRTVIWRLAFVREDPFHVYVRERLPIDQAQIAHRQGLPDVTVRHFCVEPRAAQTNRQMRFELLPYFFREHQFIFQWPLPDGWPLRNWKLCSWNDRQLIMKWLSLPFVAVNVRDIYIVCPGRRHYGLQDLLARCHLRRMLDGEVDAYVLHSAHQTARFRC